MSEVRCRRGITESRRAVLAASLAGGLTVMAQRLYASSPQLSRILVGFPAGGNVDVVARRLADFIRVQAQQTWLVENRPGAGGRLALESLKSAKPDGSTWALTPGSMITIYPHVYSNLRYEPLRDMLPVELVCQVPIAFAVGPAVPESVRDVEGYLQWVRKDDARRTSVGSPAAGAVTHFLTYLLQQSSGIKLEHVAYKGSAPGLQDLLGGHIPAMMSPLGDMLQHLASKRLRILATSGARRSHLAPMVATFVEQGYSKVLANEWFGLFAPSGTSSETVRSVAATVHKALTNPDVVGVLAQMGYEAVGEGTTATFAQRVQKETETWKGVVAQAGFKLVD